MASDWLTLLRNPEALRSTWDTAPSLADARIAEVHFERQRMRLVFDPTQPPDRPGKRWPVGANRVQVTLDVFAIESLTCEGYPIGERGRIELLEGPGRVTVMLEVGAARLRCTGYEVRVVGLSGYVDGAGEGPA